MRNCFSIYYVANCCLMVKCGDTGIIIDGPFNDYSDFDPLESSIEEDIFEGKNVFSKLDCMLFTHEHRDHFDYNRAHKCISKRNVRIAAPKNCFCYSFEENKPIPRENIILLEGDMGQFVVGEIRVHYFKTAHLPLKEDEPLPEHYSFVLEFEEHHIFISGDMNMDAESIEKIQRFGQFDAVFGNIIIAHSKSMFNNFMSLKTKNRFIYHLPSEKNDHVFYRRAAISRYKKYTGVAPYQLLLNSMTTVEMS